MLKALVTGAGGQLGQEFKNNVSNSNHEFFFTDEFLGLQPREKKIFERDRLHRLSNFFLHKFDCGRFV